MKDQPWLRLQFSYVLRYNMEAMSRCNVRYQKDLLTTLPVSPLSRLQLSLVLLNSPAGVAKHNTPGEGIGPAGTREKGSAHAYLPCFQPRNFKK